MISVSRIPAPACLAPAKVADWHLKLCAKRTQYYRDLAAYRRKIGTSPKRPGADSDHYGNSDVRKALREMFNSKCAYCEGEVAAVSPQHIEHYRPAARYPELAYHWDNLLLACPHCNCTYKIDRFPIAPTGNTPKENHRNPCARTGAGEIPFLLNPCLDTPEHHLTFRNGRVIALTERGRQTRRICGLNRTDLIKSRRFFLQFIRHSALEYQIADLEGALLQRGRHADALKIWVADTSPYSAMARAELDLLGVPWRTL